MSIRLRSLLCLSAPGSALLLLVAGIAFGEAKDDSPERIDFARQIRPILTDNCFLCHGPDEETREADLRFDLRESAVGDRGGYAAIVPGDAESSEMLLRVFDDLDPMPPESVEVTLSEDDKRLLRRWVEEGAEWEEHWAYVPPKRPQPATTADGWAHNPIDRFVFARLAAKGLEPAPEADRATLLRRVTLELTGLPPTALELDAFLADRESGAYGRVVDRLLSSPRYGEMMAKDWLDAARFGDTHGYHLDNRRSIWPYRDWVIAAFNANKPFDEFTVEQLAGDLLPDATLEQRIATGFNRCNPTTAEGGLIAEEYLAKYAVDRAETTSTVWLGSTLGCAACHDHKYDPFTQKEFYQLFAFFSSIDENASDGNAPDPKPVVRVPDERQAAELARLTTSIEELEVRLEAPLPEVDAEQARWERDTRAALDGRWLAPVVTDVTARDGTEFERLADGTLRATGPNPERDVYTLEARTWASGLRALRLDLFRDETTTAGGVGRADHGNIVLTDVKVEVAPADGSADFAPAPLVGAYADYSQVNYAIGRAIDDDPASGWAVDSKPEERVAVFLFAEPVGFASGTVLRVRLAHESPHVRHNIARFRLFVTGDRLVGPAELSNWWSIGPFPGANRAEVFGTEYGPESGVRLDQPIGDLAWTERAEFVDGVAHSILPGNIASTYLRRTITVPGPRRMVLSLGSDDGLHVWLNGDSVLANDVPRGVAPDQERLQLMLREGENELLLKVSNYGGAFGFYFRVAEYDVTGLPLGIERLAAMPVGTRTDAQNAQLRSEYRRKFSPEWKAIESELVAMRASRADLEAAIPTTMVMAERAEPRPAHVLRRGQYDQPGEVVEPGVPAVLPPLEHGAPRDRLALAHWLVDPGHPLTARVTVNRFWQKLFGTGLVESTEDFGSRGSFPTHPELLDWLAVEFVESGWDVKAFMKLLVTSSTYRQSAAWRGEQAHEDPANRMVARGPRFRLDAESVRDSALFVSGLLVEKIGGPSVKPYQPPGLWKTVGYTSSNTANFVRDTGADLYRRSLYTFWKRTSPPPSMQVFDAPTREACVVRRARTNTPLQALTLMNDVQFVEAARAFGQRIMRLEAKDDRERLRFGFRSATSHAPDEVELAVLLNILEAARQEYASDPDAAAELLGVGESSHASEADPSQLAAWTIVGSTLFNLDAFVTK